MRVFKKVGISVYAVVSAFLTLALLFAVISFFSGEVVLDNSGVVGPEDDNSERVPNFVSMSGSLENAYFENNNLVIRKDGSARLEVEPGSYKAFVDLQGMHASNYIFFAP